VEAITEVHTHRDLFLEACDRYGEWLKLEEVCERLEVETSEVRFEETTVENRVVPELGGRLLEGNKSVLGTLIEYTEADIEPLFRIAASIS